MRFLRRKEPNLTVEDRACLEGRAEALRRLRTDPDFAAAFVEAFQFKDIGVTFDVGQPDVRWLEPLGLSSSERLEVVTRATEAYFKCFVVAVFEEPQSTAMFTELVDAENVTKETFPDLTPEQARSFAVNLWRGARLRGVPVRAAGASDERK
ncbi:MAG: hypothetical protein ACYDAN_01845 [Candidatus Limnocylindrales bacterium]